MYISEPHRAVLLRVRRPARICSIIPKAKPVTVRGRDVVAVPYRLEETRVLRNLGFDVPSPITRYYDWPHSDRITPFREQQDTAAFLTMHNRAFCLNGLGTGKTLAALWAYDYLRAQGHAETLLVDAPLSTLEPTWAETIEEHLPHLRYVVLHASDKNRRRKLLDQPADVYIINHDGVGVLLDSLCQREDITHVVIDELAEVARNQRTARWKHRNILLNGPKHRRHCWGLTGTPTPSEPTDAYGQAKLLVPSAAPPYFARFRDQVMRQVSTFRWVAKEDANDRVFELLRPAIRYAREQCIDLPPTTYTERYVPLTAEQQTVYDRMKQALVAEAKAGQLLAVNEGVKVGKLLQIACGAAYTTERETIYLDATPRLTETITLIQESASKALVFVPFISTVQLVEEALNAAGITTRTIYSEVTKAARDEAFGLFQHQKDPRVLVCQPDAMSHGLTLTAASTIIWYAPTTNPGTYEQANGRITRPGQKHNTLIVHLEGSPIERRIYHRLQHRQKMQGVLLDMVQNQTRP